LGGLLEEYERRKKRELRGDDEKERKEKRFDG
jgi:hypothetical protein